LQHNNVIFSIFDLVNVANFVKIEAVLVIWTKLV